MAYYIIRTIFTFFIRTICLLLPLRYSYE